jgi:hypothetical protein
VNSFVNYKKLGRTGLKVSNVCLGSDNFGNPHGADEATSRRILARAIDDGFKEQYAGLIEAWNGEAPAQVMEKVRAVASEYMAQRAWTNYPPAPPVP